VQQTLAEIFVAEPGAVRAPWCLSCAMRPRISVMW
jgi:hypothetical protein